MSDFKFSRWENAPDVKNTVANLNKLSERYQKLQKADDTDSRVAARKTWQEMASQYWEVVFALIDAQTASMPDELVFDEQEQLFINYGYIDDVITPRKGLSPETLKKKATPDIFQYQMFTDYIAECWAAIRGKTPPAVACGYTIDEKFKLLMQQLQVALGDSINTMKRLLRFGSLQATELDELSTELIRHLMTATKVFMRTKEYRESPDAVKQNMNQERFRYTEAERIMNIQLSVAQKNEEDPIGIPETEEFLAKHEYAKKLARKIIYVQAEKPRIQRQLDRITKVCEQFSDQMMRKELKNMVVKKREYMVVPAKTARADTSPFACDPASNVLSMDVISESMKEYSTMDLDMFAVPRVRMYGIPKVILVPGIGWGSYDWGDNSLLIPSQAVNDANKAIVYALGSFRWDSDEDRHIKNGYENNINENRGKSILDLATSFYRDYFIYLTKEKKGYRVLPREVNKVFAVLFAPRKEEN